jgi:hypothetical protein
MCKAIRFLLLAALAPVLALALSGPARATAPDGQPYRIDASGRLLTAVMIDSQGPFSFVIDTASSRTLMYEHVRAQLALTKSQPGDIIVYGINTTGQALPVRPEVLTVAGQSVSGLTLGALPPGTSHPAGVDGILGIDVLAHYFVVLDRGAMRLTLLAPDSAAAQTYRDWPAAALSPRPLRNIPIDFWYLTVQFGEARLTALFDLGAGMTMMNWPAAERLGVHESNYHLSPELMAAIRDVLGTDEPAVWINGMTVAVNRRRWDGRNILVANSDVFTHFNLDEEPAAILGSDLLADNSLAIDFAGHRLYIGPPAKKAQR